MFEPMTQSRPNELSAAGGKRPTEAAPALADLPDLLLVERARGKDLRAFEALIRRYNRRLFRIARSLVSDSDTAENAVQLAHIRAFTHLDGYEPTGKFGAWLARLAFSEASMLRRRTRTDTATSAATGDNTAQRTTAAATASASTGTSAGAGAAAALADSIDTKRVLENAIDSLPEVFRTVFVLRVVEQLSGVETAACLGLNETTVRTRLFRAQQRLRSDLARRLRSEHGGLFEFDDARCERIVVHVLAQLSGHDSQPTAT